jgi:pimeloyl-ACP methyl ester carboxylesterase
LVHGIWSGPETWETFKNVLNGKAQYTILEADYKKSNAASFSENFPVVPVTIGKLLEDVKKQHIVANKVDVVAHSMGGLLVREYCRQEPDACKKQIRKLITLDTPHRGSELPDWLLLHEKYRDVFYSHTTPPIRELSPSEERMLTPEQVKKLRESQQQEAKENCDDKINKFINNGKALGLKHIGFHPVAGAVESMATGSVDVAVSTGAWNTLSSVVNEVRTHAVVGQLPKILPDIAPGSGVSLAVWWLDKVLLRSCGLSREIFHGESDGVVSVSSAEDGIPGYATRMGGGVDGMDHLTVIEQGRVVDRVEELLSGNMDLFAPMGQP